MIDANAAVPAQVAGQAGSYAGVGTVLFNMAVNPVSGKVYVANTDAGNDKRFEGPGVFAGHSVRGHLHESRITVLTPGGGVTPRHLNKHINYASCCAPAPNAESEKSLAQPQGMAISANGSKLYVAAFGSSKVGIYNTADLEQDTFVPNTADQVTVSGGGPTGILLDEARGRAYVLTRFDNSISIINTNTRIESAHVPMYNPEPASAVLGRPFLYDAANTSSHGDSSCGSCHIFGDLDGIAWDLGNPDASSLDIPGPFLANPEDFGLENKQKPLKGPMTTQSLRGMDNHGPMHWRGDRTGGYNEASAQPDDGTFDENEAFHQFNVAFKGLLGRSDTLTAAQMQAFAGFALQITYPPNPIRALDNSLTPDQQAGSDFFFNSQVDMVGSCSSCHTVDPQGNAELGVERPGFFGTQGFYTFDLGGQPMKVPHLRNVYQKVGMFGQPDHPFFPGDDAFMGDQIRGYGVNHEGGIANVFRFVGGASNGLGFEQSPTTPGGFPVGPAGEPLRRQVEAFVLAFPSNMAPVVGQQVTLTSCNASAANPRINLLIARADQGECDLTVRGRINDIERGYLYQGGVFLRNRKNTVPLSDAALRSLANDNDEQELTYTCVPPGSGRRVAIDRDEDGYRDGDERVYGSDPADPSSVPGDP